MPERNEVLVTNTTPLISLAAATGSLDVLRFLYRRVVVPYEVAQEVRAGGYMPLGWMLSTGLIGWTFSQLQCLYWRFCKTLWIRARLR